MVSVLNGLGGGVGLLTMGWGVDLPPKAGKEELKKRSEELNR